MGSLYELSVSRRTKYGTRLWDYIYFRIGDGGEPEIVSHIPNSEYVIYIPAVSSQQPSKSKLKKLTELEEKKFLDNLSKDFDH
jgi:hypothetical protein